MKSRVLLVDDEPAVLTSYSRVLIDSGFLVAKAGTGEEALRRLEATNYDVILTDLLLPKTKGLKLLERLHEHSPNLPMIVMLDTSSNEIALELAERGALQSLVKPVSNAVLKKTLNNAIRRKPAKVSIDRLVLAGFGVSAATPIKINATDAKNQMGRVLDTVIQGGVVLITRHETPKAAVIPIAEYERYSRAAEDKLLSLRNEFDNLLARMQTPEARAGMQAAFEATPEQLAKAAVRFARKRA
jgi:antitoxin Phd